MSERKRRAHTKSRHGCLQCKHRRAKCDESHPTCGQCQRRGEDCSFSRPSSDAEFTQLDLELMHYREYGPRMVFEDQDQHVAAEQRKREMELAFEHPYMLHCILALTSLEMFNHKTDSLRHYRHAVAHNVKALNHARPQPTGGNLHGEAMWVFSSLSYMFAFAEPPLRLFSPDLAHTFEPVKELVAAFRMGKGIHVVLDATKDDQHAAPINKPGSLQWSSERDTVSDDYPQLVKMRELLQQHCSAEEQAMCLDALKELYSIILLLQSKPVRHSSVHLVSTWPMHVEAGVLDMFESGSQVSLVILAQYAVMLHLRRQIWFFERWPAILMRDIDRRIEMGMRPWLEWPEQMLRVSTEAEIAIS